MELELKNAKCLPCEGYGNPLSNQDIENYFTNLPGWQLSEDKKVISRKFEFKGFYKTIGFVNAVAWIANQENHHPTMEISYNYCLVKLTTHALKGLTPNDFICAAKINSLLE